MIESGLVVFAISILAYGVFEAVRRQQVRNRVFGVPMTEARWGELKKLAEDQQRVANRWREEELGKGDNGGIKRASSRGDRAYKPCDPEEGHKHKGGHCL